MIPQPGEIWQSHRTGYKVRVKHTDMSARKIYVTDGKTDYVMGLSHFEDPGNAWRRIRTTAKAKP